MNMQRKLLGTVLIVFLLGTAGCARKATENKTAPIPVVVSVPLEQEITDYVDFTGRTAAVESVEVRSRVAGYLDRVNFKEGAMVKKGDVLFQIDPRPFVAELNRSKAQLEQAKANVAQSKADLDEAVARESRAQAGVDYMKARLGRTKRLVATNAESQEVLDLHQSEWLQAQADLKAAQANIGSSRAAINTAETSVLAADAAVAIAELNLQYASVVAPIDGRVSRLYVTEGNLIEAGNQSGGGTRLTNIVSVDPMYVYFDVDEHTALRIRQLVREGRSDSVRDGGFPVSLGLADEVGYPHQGTIDFVDNQVNPRVGTIRLRGVFSNQDQVLLPGFFARVRSPVGRPHQALLVSERALDADQGQKILYFVDENNAVVTRPVQVGSMHNGLSEITEGLKPGEKVVVTGLQHVRSGVVVEPKLVAMPVPATGGAKTTNQSPKPQDKIREASDTVPPKAGSSKGV